MNRRADDRLPLRWLAIILGTVVWVAIVGRQVGVVVAASTAPLVLAALHAVTGR